MNILLIDADNFSSPEWIDEACKKLEEAEGRFSVLRAYGSAEKLKGLEKTLRERSIRPFLNLYLSKNTTDVAMAVDAMEMASQVPKPTVIVIGSKDADFVPLVVRLRERGIRMVCVTEQSKMPFEAAAAYDSVVQVGETAIKPLASATSSQLQKKKPVPTAVSVPLKTTVRKVSALVTSKGRTEITVEQILDMVPVLRRGQAQPLSMVAELLHAQKLIGKNATSTKLFKRFPTRFELTPTKQPNLVRYLAA